MMQYENIYEIISKRLALESKKRDPNLSPADRQALEGMIGELHHAEHKARLEDKKRDEQREPRDDSRSRLFEILDEVTKIAAENIQKEREELEGVFKDNQKQWGMSSKECKAACDKYQQDALAKAQNTMAAMAFNHVEEKFREHPELGQLDALQLKALQELSKDPEKLKKMLQECEARRHECSSEGICKMSGNPYIQSKEDVEKSLNAVIEGSDVDALAKFGNMLNEMTQKERMEQTLKDLAAQQKKDPSFSFESIKQYASQTYHIDVNAVLKTQEADLSYVAQKANEADPDLIKR